MSIQNDELVSEIESLKMTIDLLNVQMKTVMRYISNKDGCNNPRDGFCTVM